MGVLLVITSRYDDALIIAYPSALQYIYPVVTIPTSFFIVTMQSRLFLFSRRKINQTIPAGAFGADLELAHFRKKHFKVAFMTGVVAVVYIVCTVPITSVFLYEVVSGDSVSAHTRNIFVFLSFCNSLADPFIYGFGISDTRHFMIRDLKRMKQFLNDILPPCTNQPTKQAKGKVLDRAGYGFAMYSVKSANATNSRDDSRADSVIIENRQVEQISSL